MGRKSNEYKKGYEAAIEAIKQALGANNESGSGQSNNRDPRLQNPPVQGKSGSNQGNQSGNNQNSRTSKSDENQGVVRPEDCVGPNELGNIPSTPGTMMDRNTGDKIAEQEGYEKEGGSDAAVEKDWADTAIREATKLKGSLKSKIEGLYKVTTDWKKELRKVVGISISPDEKRQAYANKNVLVTQDRIARTDKDKYDNVDYICAFIDSSGSMSDDQLKMCLSEVYSMALAKKPLKIVIIQCDTKIQEIKEYTSLQALKKDIIHASVKGRGGTELKPCWDLLRNDKRFKGRIADLVMVFTDGYLTQYKRDPKSMRNLCWVIIDNPSFELQYKDINTKRVIIKSEDIK
jgi:hypothetical protein